MHELLPTCFVYNKPEANLCTALTTQNTKKKDGTISHAQNTTALQPNAFLTGIHRILVTKKGRSAFLSANNCQSQLQTPQSVSAHFEISGSDSNVYETCRFLGRDVAVQCDGQVQSSASSTLKKVTTWYYTPEDSFCTFILYRCRVVTMLISSISKTCFVHWTW